MAVTTSQITITTMEGWYSGDTAPSNPLIGDLWLDTTSNEIKKWNGTNWVKQADTQGPQGPKGDSIKSREAYWIKSSSSIAPEPPDPKTGDMKGWTEGSEPPESALAGILPSDKFWRIYKETYSNGESEYIKYSEVELIGSYEVLNGLVQFRNGVTTTENIDGQDVTVIDGGKIKTGSIDAKKIHVEDLEALKATIGGFHIGKNSIYSGNKKTIDSTERGIYFDSNGQSYFGDDKNFIRFFRSDKDNYKLQISADSLTFGSGVSVEKAFEDIKGDIQNAQGTADNAQSSADKAQNTANKAQTAINNLEIGGRNLVTNSINLSDFKIESSNYTTRVISEDCCIVNRLVNHINSGSKYGIYKDIRVTAGEEYTVSCTVKEITGSMQLGLGDANMWVGLGSWNLSVGRFTCTVTAPSSATFIRIYIFGNDGVNGGSATVSNIKLEKGNRATDWTPAPEDVDAGIANAQTTADTAKTNAATAQSTADTAKANAAAAQTAADNAQSTANTAQSKADKAHGAANKAQSSANTAQNTANKAQTAADEALKGSKENAAQMAQMVTNFNGDIKNLQDQIDGNITTWFYDNDPAINLPPVTDWDTDKKKDVHLGDIYYNTVKGYAWRFMKSESTYSWERITDTDVTKALADAAEAKDTADSKRRVFYNTPSVPYDAGDLWVQGSDGDILRCAQAKTSTGSYNRNDWVLASKYTDDSALTTWITGDFATTIQGLEEGLVDAKIETYYQTTDPSIGWSSTQKLEHEGDLWYNSTASVQKYYRWSGTTWQELTATPPKEVFDSIDNKATIYTGITPPSNPSQGDLWFKGEDEPILTYVGNAWVKYDKYTDDTRAEEAAKTADNYISADSTGIMVSENKGAIKETPSNATKNNVLITDQDVQIRNGKKVVASYGKTTILGDLNSNNITLTSDGIVLNDGKFISATIEATKYTGETIEDRELFLGNVADSYVRLGRTWTVTYDLTGPVGSVESVVLNGSSGDTLTIPFNLSGPYWYLRSRNSLKIHVDGTFSETKDIDWTNYITVTIVYTKQKYTAGTITCDETHNINCYAEMVEATDRMFVGKRYNLVRINDVRKIFVIGNGNPDEKSNAAAIMQNGDIRLKGNVYFGCRKDSSGGKTIVDLIYPVGSIYMSVNSADPGTLIGGTWERIKDRFLLSAGDTYAAGNTGGSAKATLPSHTHTFGSGGYQMWGAKIGTGSTEPGNQISGDSKYYAAAKGKSTSNYKWLESVDSKGASDVSQANMPPYLAVYVWKRIS